MVHDKLLEYLMPWRWRGVVAQAAMMVETGVLVHIEGMILLMHGGDFKTGGIQLPRDRVPKQFNKQFCGRPRIHQGIFDQGEEM